MEQLIKAFEELSISWNDSMLDKFTGYMEAVLAWNEKVNLTAITDRDEFIKKHYIDSIACFDLLKDDSVKTVIDVGTGAGFPGVPLAILFPEKQFVLLDSLNKKIKIINEIASELSINNVKAVHGRAEELAQQKEYREKFDLCLARAVANLSVLSEYCLPFVKTGGYFAAYKTASAAEEISQSKGAIEILGGELEKVKNVKSPVLDLDHSIILIHKTGKTPAKYPRKAGTPTKEPLK